MAGFKAPVISPVGVLRIVVDGHSFTVDELRLVKSVRLVHHRAKADKLTIVIRDPQIEMMDRNIFDPGKRLMVLCGWSDNVITKGPFIIQTMKIVFPESGEITFTIEALDRTVGEMSKQARSRNFAGSRASDILKAKAAEYGLVLEASFQENDDLIFDEEFTMTQSGESDAQFIQRLANRLGYVWGIRDVNSLYFARPEEEYGDRVLMEYRTGAKTIKHFEPEMKVFTYGGKKAAAKQVVCHVSPYNNTEASNGVIITPGFERGAAIANLSQVAIPQVGGSFSKAVQEEVTRGGANPEIDKAAIPDPGPGNELPPSEIAERASRFAGQSTFTMAGAEDLISALKTTSENLAKEATDIVRADAGGAVPGGAKSNGQQQDQSERHAKKKLRKKLKMVKARLVPTVPSWAWSSFETLDVEGVGVRCSGRYDVVEARLGFDNTNGLTTELVIGRHTIPKKKTAPNPCEAVEKRCGPGATEVRDSPGNGAGGNPRGSVAKEGGGLGNKAVVFFNGITNQIHRVASGSKIIKGD